MTTPRRALTMLALGFVLAADAPATAQESMRFEPVPEESVQALDRRMRRTSPAPAAPAAPRTQTPGRVPPVPPVPPIEAPEAPEPVVMRSGDIMRIASDIHVEKDQVVDGDVVAMGGDVRVDGHVKGNVVATGGDVELGATSRVDGDVMCLGGELRETAGASVGGQRVTAMRGREREEMRRRIKDRMRERFDLDDVHIGESIGEKIGDFVGAIVWALVWMGIAWAVLHFAPQRTATALATLKREPGMSLAIGFLSVLLLVPSLIALALVVVVLCITIIGIPVAIGVLLAYCALLVLIAVWGSVIGVIPVGERLGAATGRPQTMLRSALLGVLAAEGMLVVARAFDLIPFMGWVSGLLGFFWWVIGSLLFLVGAGALLRSKFGLGPEGRWWPIRPAGPPSAPVGGPGAAPSAPPAPPAAPVGAPASYGSEPPPPVPPAPPSSPPPPAPALS